ncbi:MAG: hypothetical protein ACLTSX_10995 [Collinsella sp.]
MVVDKDVEILDVAVSPRHIVVTVSPVSFAHVSYDAQMLGCTTSSLEVEADNEAARARMRILGFEQVGRRRGYYGAGRDAHRDAAASLPLVLPVDAASPSPRPRVGARVAAAARSRTGR